jgi:pimeloyl-ACP methyl ester carboxylesterase
VIAFCYCPGSYIKIGVDAYIVYTNIMLPMEQNISKEGQAAEAAEYINNFSIQKAKVDDIEIEYKIIGPGRGKPIIFVPGLKVTMNMWEPIILKELALSNYSVIVFNNRGTGSSSIGAKEYSIGQLANDAAGLLDALSIKRADVLGWSMGSYIAQDLALMHPSKVNNLILYGSGPGGDKAIPSSPELMQTLNNISGTPEEQARQVLSLFFPQAWLQMNPDYVNLFPLLKGILSLETVQKQAQAIINWKGTYDSPSQISHPTLVLVGMEDVITTPKASLFLVEKIPLVWLVQISGAGHGWMYQYPEKFSKVVRTFLDIN